MILKNVPMDWISAGCPLYIREALVRVRVKYHTFDGAVRAGELVVNRDVAREIDTLFHLMFVERFPICTITPAHIYDFSNAALALCDVTSGFNFYYIYGMGHVSWHGYGLGVNINPRENPMTLHGHTHPPDAVYCPGKPGVLDAEHFVVRAFKELGWEWGGDRTEPFNPHILQKPLNKWLDT